VPARGGPPVGSSPLDFGPTASSRLNPHLGLDDIHHVWRSDPLFYPAKPPAHWLMCAEVADRMLVVPLAPADSGDPRRR